MDFSIVAHDLRTPLNAMLGHTQMLAVEKLSAAGRRRLEIIETQIRRMATLLNSCTPPRARPGQVWIADRHGATIRVTSRPGEGSTFTVYLPLACRPGRSLPIARQTY